MPPQQPLPLVRQKRAFDISIAAALLVLLAPLFAFFFVLIALEHALRGHPTDPLLYSEKRVSRGRLFNIYKFNIFNQRVVDAMRMSGTFIHTKSLEHNGGLIAVGWVLKQIYLDELPQLINVLTGDMSLVGPRPVNTEVYAAMQAEGTPTIALLPGGMTGNYQSRKNTRGASAAELNDAYLAKYRRGGWRLVATDIVIILRTLGVLARAKGV